MLDIHKNSPRYASFPLWLCSSTYVYHRHPRTQIILVNILLCTINLFLPWETALLLLHVFHSAAVLRIYPIFILLRWLNLISLLLLLFSQSCSLFHLCSCCKQVFYTFTNVYLISVSEKCESEHISILLSFFSLVIYTSLIAISATSVVPEGLYRRSGLVCEH